jgi:hypothetical protein
MKTNLVFSLLVLVQFVACCLCCGDDGSARRYVNFMGNDELFLTFCLLERGDVQHELKMTVEQIAIVEHLASATTREIPGLMDLLAKNQKRQSDPTLSASDKEKLGKAATSDAKSWIEAYQRKELSATLSASQGQRLGELLIQMRGPIATIDDAAVRAKLQFSNEQLAALRQTGKDYDADIRLPVGRYGRQQISGKRYPNETDGDRQKELAALFVVIRAIERERDGALLQKLTPQQLESWTIIQGKLFPIAWPPTSVSDFPFGKNAETKGTFYFFRCEEERGAVESEHGDKSKGGTHNRR